MERATTNQCKQEIIDVVCQHQTDSMFAKTLPRYCPLKGLLQLTFKPHIFVVL